MLKSYYQIGFCRENESNPEIAIVAIPFEDNSLISDGAKLAKTRLEENIGEPVKLVNYSWLGTKLTIIE